jgi:hypothetical protein
MQLRQATRQKAKIRLGMSSVSGGGKTYSAILVAFGLVGSWEKIAVIDTENNSADLYAHLGPYNVLSLNAPYSPERYIEAIDACIAAGVEVIIIDSITHEWDGVGGILHTADQMTGNSYTNWSKLTPRHNAFINKILQAPVHIITTVRRKQDYELVQENGKAKPVKVGLKEVTREGFEYELTVNLEIDVAHFATSSKDRTGLFAGKPPFVPSPETGKLLRTWCESGVEALPVQDSREVLSLTHPSFTSAMNAVLSGAYQLSQVESKYKIDPAARQVIEAAIVAASTPTVQPPAQVAPAPLTQEQIHSTNETAQIARNATQPVNGSSPKKPF